MNTLNFTFNFNAPVGQNIAHVDKLEAHFDKDMTMQVVDTDSLEAFPHAKGSQARLLGRDKPLFVATDALSRRPKERGLQTSLNEERLVYAVNAMSPLPEVLLTDKARALHTRLREAGMVDEGWMPVGLSNAEKGTLAEYLTERLNITAKWKLWGSLWGMNPETLRTAKARGLEQERTWAFRSRLEAL